MKRLVRPLHMNATTITAGAVAGQPNVVSPHALIGGGQRPIAWRDIDIISPAGSLNSTAADMATWLRFQMADGVAGGTRLVSSASLGQTHSPQSLIPVTPAMKRARLVENWPAYAMGWNVMDYRGHPLIWHSGNADGQPSIMGILPDDHVGVVIMMNSWVAGTLHGLLMNRVFDTYLGVPAQDWSGDALARKAAIRAGNSSAVLQSPRIEGTRPSHPLQAFAGRYVDSLYGAQTVRVEGGTLTLQMGGPRGQVADLSHWHHDTFLVRWRDPLFGEIYSTLVTFGLGASGEVEGLVMQVNRDRIVARRAATE
jgi:CubicO group peptidase (beta-lactamase class C family)